ncbi:hypothetical protein LCGC14_1262690 [marine sediment metagenome]|uniref:Uncharacterized protein n=1 Tax=marine sediment metagenome TaxID=412755 RepID=A0A0F9LLK8_9ZZZZ
MARRICPLLRGGEVALDFEKDVQAVVPIWDEFNNRWYTKVITTAGTLYHLKGQTYTLQP